MPIAVQCAGCNSKYRVPDKFAGATFTCRNSECKARTVVPQVEQPAGGMQMACEHCGNDMLYEPEDAGRVVACPHCDQLVALPGSAPPEAVLPTVAAAPPFVPTENAIATVTRAEPLADAARCRECGGRLHRRAERCRHCGASTEARQDADTLSPGTALRFGFQSPGWFSTALVAGLLVYVPLAGRLAVRGWRLEIARRVFHGARQPLPGFDAFGSRLLDGCRLRLLWCVYQLPVLAATIFLAVMPYLVGKALMRGETWDEIKVELAKRALQFLVSLLVELWLFVGQMLFWAGLVRYLQTGRWYAFLQFVTNARLVFANLGLFVVFLFWGTIAHFVLKLLQAFLVATGVATLFVPLLTSPTWNWSRGHLWGQLARIVSQREAEGFTE